MLKRVLSAVVLETVLLALGCDGRSGRADAGNPGSGGTGAGGGSGGDASFDPTPFLGAWSEIVSVFGPGTAGCPDVYLSTTTPTTITVSPGTSSDLVRTEPSLGDCSVPLNLATDHNAVLARPIECVTTSGTFNFSIWTFSTDGSTASESAGGTIALPGAGTCPATVTTTLTR